MTAPIRIRCKGSGRGHLLAFGVMCWMCGAIFSRPLTDSLAVPLNSVPEHDRDDILAMIERGDYG